MAVRSIVVVPHEVLRKKAEEISDIDDRVRKLALDMAETMYKAPGIGLAANQVGHAIQLIVLDVAYAYSEQKDKKKEPIILINPQICLCEGEDFREEGCLSVPELEVEVKRGTQVQVKAVDLDGHPVTIETDGLLARVLQHEIDHLQGTTILDHASALKRGLYNRRIKKASRRAK